MDKLYYCSCGWDSTLDHNKPIVFIEEKMDGTPISEEYMCPKCGKDLRYVKGN